MNGFNNFRLANIHYFIPLGAGLALGAACLVLPPVILLAGLAGTIYVIAFVKRPEIALLGILCVTSTVINIYSLPSFSLGFGHLMTYDALIVVPLVFILIKALNERHFVLFQTPLAIPLLGFYIIALLSTAIAFLQGSVSFNQTLGELRSVNGFLIFFIATQLIRSKAGLIRLLKGILFFSILVAMAMIIQYIVGSSVKLLPGRVEVLGTGTIVAEKITRVLPPGQSLVMLGFVSSLFLMIMKKGDAPSIKMIVQVAVLGLAVILTFNRNFWVGIGLAIAIASCLLPLSNKVKIVSSIIILCLVMVVVIPTLSPIDSRIGRFVDAVTIRFSSLFSTSILNESSLEYRAIENSYAFPQILAHPIIGLGLGGIYRPWDVRLERGGNLIYEHRAYIHNGYLWIMLKTGLIGFLFFAGLILLFLWRGFKKWKNISDTFLRIIYLSTTVTVAGLLASVTVNPIFNNTYWTPVIGVMLAINELILNFDGGTITIPIISEAQS